MVNRGIRRHITKTDLLKFVGSALLWNVKSSTEERNVVRHASGMQRYIRQNAGHESRTLWTMKQHRAAASASEPNVEICKDRQRVAPHAAPVEDQCWLAAGRAEPDDANMEVAESTAGQPTSSVIRTWEAVDDTSAKRQRLMAGMLTWTSTWTRQEILRSQEWKPA